jgi:hypothetical protein
MNLRPDNRKASCLRRITQNTNFEHSTHHEEHNRPNNMRNVQSETCVGLYLTH